MKKYCLFLIIFSFFFSLSYANDKTPDFSSEVSDSLWVDSLMSTMSIDQKIGQLFMVAAYSNKKQQHIDFIKDLIENYQIGGLMFMQGGPIRQVNLVNQFQSISRVPLMIAQDAEWGPSMRIDSTVRFPWQMTLGAITNNDLIYEFGQEVARQCKRLGVNINFAPVVDVNSNPDNPIINNRSFGENPYNVAQKSIAYMQGMQDAVVMACAKHFPGHGDTDSDSHKTLPTINNSKEYIDTVDLVPFKALIQKGVGSIMVAHLFIPSLDDSDTIASTLSPKIVDGLLKEELGFKGLVFTDALNMKGVSDYFEAGNLDVKALLAGNDVLLFSEDVPKAIQKIKEAIANKLISEEEINARCKKILKAKYWMGLSDFKKIQTKGLYQDLNNSKVDYLNKKLVKNSITLLQNNNDIIPLKGLDTLKTATLCIGTEEDVGFYEYLKRYDSSIDYFYINEFHSEEQRTKILKQLFGYDLVIASLHKSNANAWKSFHIDQSTDILLQSLAMQNRVVLNIFANPYSINDLLMTYAFDALIMSYQNSDYAHDYSAQLIYGGIIAKGKLPVSNQHFNYGDGLSSSKIRLSYGVPNDLGIDDKMLKKVDSIARYAVEIEATPGCQIMAIKDGVVFYNKNFGHHTYKNSIEVKSEDLYDIASITKITSSVPFLMKMVDDGSLSLNDELGEFISFSDTSSKKHLTFREILAHQSGLQSWIPFYKKTLESGKLRDTLYDTTRTTSHNVMVADQIYLHKDYPDSILQQVINSKLKEEKKYLYSDLGYYLIKEVIENYYEVEFEVLFDSLFANKLGLSMTFLPNKKNKSLSVVPTEFDYYFRSQLVSAHVHDMGAAMLGGVGGHAGIFASANDLAIFMQMYLQKGAYGGHQFFTEATVKEFTKCQFCEGENRRGAGFDKAVLENQEGGPACDCNPSSKSFGHSGFTGTLVWVDPDEHFVYVFLSNRIHPTSDNKKLLEENIRTEIMHKFYDAIR